MFDKFQKNKKILKAKQAQIQVNKVPEDTKQKKLDWKSHKGQKTSKTPNVTDIRNGDAKRSNKRTDEGFKIYTEEELRLGDGKQGNTSNCPFDCECCY